MKENLLFVQQIELSYIEIINSKYLKGKHLFLNKFKNKIIVFIFLHLDLEDAINRLFFSSEQ